MCVDPSNAARTLLFDPATQTWVPELLAAFGIPASVLPRPVPTVHGYGTLRVGERRIPLMACTGDQAAAVFAHGELEPDRAWLNAGTGAFLQRAIAATARPTDGLLKSVLFSNASRVVCSLEGTTTRCERARLAQARVRLDVPRGSMPLHGRARRMRPSS